MTMENELLRNLTEKPSTIKFPYEKDEPPDRMRGKVTWEIEKCIGCTLCVKTCPSAAIQLIGRGKEAEVIYDSGRCIFCGECVDICPTKSIYTTTEYELAFTYHKQMTTYFNRKKKSKSSKNK